jgi:hypothetical protein
VRQSRSITTRQEQARDQEEIRHPERLCERHQRMHEAGLAGGRLDAQHRMHHHHHDDADALGVVDPVDASVRNGGTVGRGRMCRLKSSVSLFGAGWPHHRPIRLLSPLFIQMLPIDAALPS